jgi:hypothetical protein
MIIVTVTHGVLCYLPSIDQGGPMKIEKNLATADLIVRLIFAIGISSFFLLNLIKGTFASGLLILGGMFFVSFFYSFIPITRKSRRSIKKEWNPNDMHHEKNQRYE